jgi:hypothetical protein
MKIKKNQEVTILNVVESPDGDIRPKIIFADTTVRSTNLIYAYANPLSDQHVSDSPYYRKKRSIKQPLYGFTSFMLDRLDDYQKDKIQKNSSLFTRARGYDGGGYYIDHSAVHQFLKKEGLI